MRPVFPFPFRVGAWSASFLGKDATKGGCAALARGRVCRLRLRAGDELVCARGCLWLVADGGVEEPEDIVLEAGERRVWAREETLLAEALRDATWHVERAPLPRTCARTAE